VPADGEHDAGLVALIRDGNVLAFADLYRAHAPSVAFAVRDHVRDPETVADLVQESFARALERLDSLREPEHFGAWVLQIARHAAIDERRQRGRVRLAAEDLALHLKESTAGPEDLAELRDLLHRVRGCIAGLSRRDATAVVLVGELGFSPAALGAALGISPGSAKVVVHRARRRLADALAQQELVRSRARDADRAGSPTLAEISTSI
jgi:RNA polymerase sigma factor (sigma-70 family)